MRIIKSSWRLALVLIPGLLACESDITSVYPEGEAYHVTGTWDGAVLRCPVKADFNVDRQAIEHVLIVQDFLPYRRRRVMLNSAEIDHLLTDNLWVRAEEPGPVFHIRVFLHLRTGTQKSVIGYYLRCERPRGSA